MLSSHFSFLLRFSPLVTHRPHRLPPQSRLRSALHPLTQIELHLSWDHATHQAKIGTPPQAEIGTSHQVEIGASTKERGLEKKKKKNLKKGRFKQFFIRWRVNSNFSFVKNYCNILTIWRGKWRAVEVLFLHFGSLHVEIESQIGHC